MPTKLITKYSTTAAASPSSGDLDTGELAVNTIDKRLYTEDDASNVVEIGTNPSSLTLGGAVTITTGSGSPNGTVTANIGSLYYVLILTLKVIFTLKQQLPATLGGHY